MVPSHILRRSKGDGSPDRPRSAHRLTEFCLAAAPFLFSTHGWAYYIGDRESHRHGPPLGVPVNVGKWVDDSARSLAVEAWRSSLPRLEACALPNVFLSPRGGGGPGGFRSARQFGEQAAGYGIPHSSSPLGRNAVLSTVQTHLLHERKLKINQLNASAAVGCVQSKMTVGSGNKLEDVVMTLGGSLSASQTSASMPSSRGGILSLRRSACGTWPRSRQRKAAAIAANNRRWPLCTS